MTPNGGFATSRHVGGCGRGMEDVVYAQAQFNLYRSGEWVTVGAGVEDDVVRHAASGLYGRIASPLGDVPHRVRVHRAADATEELQAAIDLRISADWEPIRR
jgi:hypothetical protein